MGKEMEKYISKRCEKALLNCEEYMELQRKCATAYKEQNYEEYSDLVGELQVIVENECYKQGMTDACTHFCTRNFAILKNIIDYLRIIKYRLIALFKRVSAIFRI